jgi:sterol desaturase/sphingolipid hydroxylase (fatty acid hydroxylase superfamily)
MELAALILTYYASAIVQMASHALFGHTKRLQAIYRSHTFGHHGTYSRRDLLQDKWVSSERHVLWYFAIPFAPLIAWVYVATPRSVFLSHLAGLAFSIWWHIFLHRQYHVRHSPLERFAWFQRKRQWHFVHHRRVRNNYAIVELWLDRLIGTFRAA